jgi:hypothetical protein
MVLKFVIAKLEDADEAVRPLYKQRADGKFQLDTDAESADDIAGLKSALAKEKEDALALKAKIDGLNNNEIKELKRLKKEREDAERKALEDSGNFDAVKAQMIAKHNEEIDLLKQGSTALRKQLERIMVQDAATQAIVEAKGNPKLLGPIVRQAIKLDETNGEFSVRVVDASGNPLVSDAKGTPMSILQYVESLKAMPDYQPAFQASGSSGGGTPPGGGGTGDFTKPLKSWTPEERRTFINEKGLDAFRDLVANQKAA